MSRALDDPRRGAANCGEHRQNCRTCSPSDRNNHRVGAVYAPRSFHKWRRTTPGTATSESGVSLKLRRWARSTGRSAVERLASLWIRRRSANSNRSVGKRVQNEDENTAGTLRGSHTLRRGISTGVVRQHERRAAKCCF